jgi:RNA polymerase sigma factor (sigma-70 family)
VSERYGGPGAGDGYAVQDAPAPSPSALRVDFGAHFEANYQRLVAQVYAITLDAGEAHDAVQDAYSRAWRSWAQVRRTADPAAWVRRVAVRSTIRSWRRILARLGLGGTARPSGRTVDPRTRALLDALARLPVPERRAVVLFHMVGAPVSEIAALERVSTEKVEARLGRARHVVTEGMADVLPAVLGSDHGVEYR